MLLVTRLIKADAEAIETEAQLAEDCIFLKENGILEPVAFFEIMAQCLAAGSGIVHPAPWGYLAGIKKMRLFGQAKAGDVLLARVHPVTRLDRIVAVAGEVLLDGKKIAEGQLKIYIPNEKETEEGVGL